MKRSEKKVLTAVMKRPCTLADLLYQLRLPAWKIKQAALALVKAGDIELTGGKFYIRKGKP